MSNIQAIITIKTKAGKANLSRHKTVNRPRPRDVGSFKEALHNYKINKLKALVKKGG